MHVLRRVGSGGVAKVLLEILAMVVAAGVALAVVAVLSERQSAEALEAPTEGSEYSITDLGTLRGGLPGGDDISVAFGINNRGQVMGVSYTASGEQHAVLWSK